MKAIVISSPRSGNTWVRHVLARVAGLSTRAEHNYRDFALPLEKHCILQVHWYREPHFQHFVADNDLHPLTICRHPLDVLISVLHFCRFEPAVTRWLEGNVEIPDQLFGAKPSSPEFLEYALSWGAENLLAISYQWWHDTQTLKLRYEDLVASPVAQFGEILQALDWPGHNIAEALAAESLDSFRGWPNRHGWQGAPGLWKQLLTTEAAAAIYQRHRRVFEVLEYAVFETGVSPAASDEEWERLRSQ